MAPHESLTGSPRISRQSTVTKIENCSIADCEQAVVSSLGGDAICLTHFISICYTQLDRYAEMLKGHGLSGSDSESMRRFIHECVRQADEIEHGPRDLDNLERARLLNIIEGATDLGRQLRRSPRKAASIAVRVCCDKLGGAWEEDTETLLLSRYGASLRCSRPADPRASLQVVRLDTGQKVQARVAWQRPAGSEGSRIGVEFVDCDNFWGLDWAAIEEAR
jgi:hypothetical protein